MVPYVKTNGLGECDKVIIFLMLFFFIASYSLFSLLLSSVKTGESITRGRIEELALDATGFGYEGASKRKKKSDIKLNLNFIRISKRLAEDINVSGINISGEEFIFLWILITVVPSFLYFNISQSMLKTVFVIFLLALIPPIYIRILISRKRIEFEKQLGGFLQVLSNGIRSGFSFQQAISNLSQDMPDPLGEEFRTASREIILGVDVETSFSKIAYRMDSEDMDILTAAIVIQQQVGGNLASILDTISETIRDRLNMRALVRTLTAQGRISGMIIGLIPIGLLFIITFINPEYSDIFFTTTYGKMLLLLSAILEGIGFAVIRKIIDIKY